MTSALFKRTCRVLCLLAFPTLVLTPGLLLTFTVLTCVSAKPTSVGGMKAPVQTASSRLVRRLRGSCIATANCYALVLV